MLITNNTEFVVGVLPHLIHPKKTLEVDDELAAKWLKKPDSQHLVRTHQVTVQDAPELGTAPAATAQADEERERPHWKTAVKAAASCDSLDELELMLAGEDRPRVQQAIRDRMDELKV